MTPDMKCLCNEAWRATQKGLSEGKMPHDVNEAIVRAVLMALREPSDDVVYAAAKENGCDEIRFVEAKAAIRTAIDHILGDSATG